MSLKDAILAASLVGGAGSGGGGTGGGVQSVNGIKPDGNGNVEIEAGPADWNTMLNKPFGEEIGEAIAKDKTMTVDSDMGLVPEDGVLPFVAGNTYVVTWDGKDYECEAVNATMMGVPIIGVGNLAMAGGEDNGLPFGIVTVPSYGFSAYGAKTAGTYTFSIFETTIEKIESKYLGLDWLPIISKSFNSVLDNVRITGINGGGAEFAETYADVIIAAGSAEVIWNGQSYMCDVITNTVDFMGTKMTASWLGNREEIDDLGSIFGDGTGEPFGILLNYESGGVSLMNPKVCSNTHANETVTVSVRCVVDVYNKMPADFLPDIYGMPTFDLASMGLSLPASGQKSQCSASFDELIKLTAAAQSGFMWFIFQSGTALEKLLALPTNTGDAICFYKSGAEYVDMILVNFYPNGTEDGSIYATNFPLGSNKYMFLNSSTEGSTKRFRISVDDTGTLTAVEVSS